MNFNIGAQRKEAVGGIIDTLGGIKKIQEMVNFDTETVSGTTEQHISVVKYDMIKITNMVLQKQTLYFYS